MKWSYLFGEYFGIAVRMHVSFLLLVAWIALSVWTTTGSFTMMLGTVVTIGALFTCVVLHEYGHALMARHFGIGTREITLLPIGGVAQLDRIPEDPRQELAVALAGPAVNVVLAGIAALLMAVQGSLDPIVDESLLGGSLIATLFRVNVIMAVFNLIPALPMDGGRVLRALLAIRLPALQATRIATNVAKALAGAMMLTGLFGGQLMLGIVGGFVWIASGAEYDQARRTDAGRRGLVGRFRRGPGGSADPPGEWLPGDDIDPRLRGRDYRVEVVEREPDGTLRIRVVRREPDAGT